MRSESKPSIQYYLTATAVIAISLAILMQPPTSQSSAKTPVSTTGQSAQLPNTRAGDASLNLWDIFPIRLAILMVGVSTTTHIVASFLNLHGLVRWCFGIVAPVACAACWHLGGFERAYFSLTEILLLATPICAFSFAFVSFVFNAIFSQDSTIR